MESGQTVALLAEGVDRNLFIGLLLLLLGEVALLAEGVDRNPQRCTCDRAKAVALLAEGVDRNIIGKERTYYREGRPPRGGRG